MKKTFASFALILLMSFSGGPKHKVFKATIPETEYNIIVAKFNQLLVTVDETKGIQHEDYKKIVQGVADIYNNITKHFAIDSTGK